MAFTHPLVTELETVLQPEVPDAVQLTKNFVAIDVEHLLDVVAFEG